MLKELEERKDQLRKELGEVDTAIRNIKLETARKKYGVRVGSIVKNRDGKEFRNSLQADRPSRAAGAVV